MKKGENQNSEGKFRKKKKALDKSVRVSYNFLGNEVEACPLLARRPHCRGRLAFFSYAKSGHACPLFFAQMRKILWRCIANNMADLMMNEEIRDREVRVIDQNGEQLGVLPIRKALELAEEAGLDLVKIVPTAKPPVCKLMDYDKFRYEQAKKEREIRRNQKVVSIKEVQLSATIEENDIQTKAKAAVKFLQGGDKVKVSIRFRGRQITHQEIGLAVMQDFVTRVKDVAVVERKPLVEGRHMIMILAPKDPSKEAKQAPKE